jgi:hypothetical protein
MVLKPILTVVLLATLPPDACDDTSTADPAKPHLHGRAAELGVDTKKGTM